MVASPQLHSSASASVEAEVVGSFTENENHLQRNRGWITRSFCADYLLLLRTTCFFSLADASTSAFPCRKYGAADIWRQPLVPT